MKFNRRDYDWNRKPAFHRSDVIVIWGCALASIALAVLLWWE